MTTELSTEFYADLVTFLLQTKQHFLSVSGDFGLTSVQALTLLMLDDHQAPSMSSLCKRYECDASNITGIIDGLEQKGLVSRCPDPKDRRVKTIRIEPAGKALQTKLIERFAEVSDHIFDALDASEKHQFAGTLKKLANREKVVDKP